MLRVIIFLSGILSFIYFIRPDTLPAKKAIGETLGVSKINQAVNAEIVRQALLIHCINKQKLPTALNQLYGDELSKEKFVDLDSIYRVEDKGNCDFELIGK